LSKGEVVHFASQMYLFSREFSRFLGATLAACSVESARVVIAENLWEEMGEGKADMTHPALFRRFTRALGLSDQMLEATPPTLQTRELVDVYLSLPERYGYLGALAGLCFGSEGLVSILYSQILGALERSTDLPASALLFFKVHIECDDGHADALEQILATQLKSPAEMAVAEDAVVACLNARAAFFDGCSEMVLGAPTAVA